MGSPANHPFGVPPEQAISNNSFFSSPFGSAPAQNTFGPPAGTPFGVPAQNPFGLPSSNPFGNQPSSAGNPFGAPSVQSSAPQSRGPSPAPPIQNPFGSQPAQNSFGSKPATGFGAPTSFGPGDGNDMARRGKGNQRGGAKTSAFGTASGPQDKRDKPKAVRFDLNTSSGAANGQFGAQGDKGPQRANLFKGPKGSSLKREVARVAAPTSVPSSQRKKNERPERSQPPTQNNRDNKGPTREPSEGTKQLSPFAYDYANKLYDHLKKENIKPPTWPSQLGNPDKRGAVETLKESYKKYRTRAYASLRKADLIDDPDKRRKLADALPFKGICEDMCPEFEQVSRIAEYDVKVEEKDERGWPDTAKMVKKFGRSAAGQDAPLPMDVRSVAALRRSTDYLFNELLQSENNLALMHNYLRDRTRAVRKDFTFHSKKTREEMKELVYCFETITRFHATALHLLCRKSHSYESFDHKQEIEQLGRTLLSLIEAYDKCRKKGVVCENEPEFRAYYLLLNAHDPSIMKRILTWGKEYWFQSEEVQTALSLIQVMDDIKETKGPLKPRRPTTLSDTSFANYFAIVEDARTSYTMACIAEVHFTWVRQNILKNLVRGYSRHRDAPRTITAANLNKLLRFDTDEEAVEFIELHGFEMSTWVPPNRPPVTEPYLLLNNKKKVVPSPRVPQAYSGKIVERKRTTQSLPYVIYNTIYEETTDNPAGQDIGMEDELFVSQNNTLGSSSAFGLPAVQPPVATSPFTFAPSTNGAPAAAQAPKPPASVFMNPSSPQLAPASAFSGFGAPAPSTNPFGQTAGPSPAPSANPFGQPAAPLPAGPTASPFTGFGSNTTPAPVPAPAQPPSQPAAGKSQFSFGTPQTTAFGSSATANSSAGAPASSFSFTKPSEPPAPVSSSFSFLNKDTSSTQPSIIPSSAEKASPFGNNAAPISTTPPAPAQPQASAFSFTKPTEPAPPPSFPGMGPSLAAGAPLAKPPTSLEAARNAFDSAPVQQPAIPSISITQPTPTSNAFPTAQATQSAASAPSQFQFPAQSPFPSVPPAQNAPAASFTGGIMAPPQPPAPPKRDLMAGFTKWFVTGDGGLMEQFTENTVQNLVWDVFQRFQIEEAERKRKEEDEESWRLAREHMYYRVACKYFYRWREVARRLSMKRRLQEGKRQMKEYREQQKILQKQQEEERQRAEKEARRAAKRKADEDVLQFGRLIKREGRRRSSIAYSAADTEEQLMRTGIFGGLPNERELAKRVATVEDPSWKSYGYPESELELVPAPKELAGSPDSNATQREGWKTRSLRERFVNDKNGRRSVSAHSSVNGRASLGLNRSTNFSSLNQKKRRSAEIDGGVLGEPDAKRQSFAMSTTSVGSASTSRPHRSRHWEMRLRGFVPGPDGNWVAESLAHSQSTTVPRPSAPAPMTELEIRLARIKRDHMYRSSGGSARGSPRGSQNGMSPPPPPPPLWNDSDNAANKRKRTEEMDEDVVMARRAREFSPTVGDVGERGRSRSGTTTRDMVEDTQRMLRELRETMELLERDRLVIPGNEGEYVV
ncbi:SAC3/GANP/Nin1/mts3/eIF-3 p25 family-domain-containing protein [Apiosordaria backusii]|uniref:SAC3/GANP/Nin1/mts3/eIF-3 p25 family-domain-containing protein n=1 Tax=Apiosordaria backusii TaxID=314023 RepID=A0AA40BJU9_9PEZI|nr:SAC3/GANP/Nin1/mts3/eIF-3 p25 family-domain-containing protein [Apiosordaria backusii]